MAWYDETLTHGYSTSVSGVDTPHYARDYATGFHELVTSLIAGKVVKADYTPWGGEVFIKPDQPTDVDLYYYHFDLNKVSSGQHVNAGDVIGLAGGENPGYPGAQHPAQPQYSSGLHTHVGWIYANPTSGDPSTGFRQVPEYEGLGGQMYPNYTIPEGPDIGTLIDYYREHIPGAPPSSAIPDTSGATQAASAAQQSAASPCTPPADATDLIGLLQYQQCQAAAVAKGNPNAQKDANGCTIPTSWLDPASVTNYFECQASVGGGYVMRGIWMILGMVLIVTGVRMMMRPPADEGGQSQGGGGGGNQPSIFQDVKRAAVTGAASAVGGVAGEAAAKKIASKFRKKPAPTKVP